MGGFYFESLLIVGLLGCCATSIHLLISIQMINKRQSLAYSGDESAARRLILPCYKPLFLGLSIFFAVSAIGIALSFLRSNLDDDAEFRRIEYFCFIFTAVYSITPVLLVQRAVSIIAFWNTFYCILPWCLSCTLLWGLSFISGTANTVFDVLFVVLSSFIPSIFAVLILSNVIKSRIQLGSFSNRNSVELLLLYSLIYGISFTLHINHSSGGNRTLATVMTVTTFLANQLFPFALYRTLLADTKFWRGLGKHNKGFQVREDLRSSAISVIRPTMELSVASRSMQDMMVDLGDMTIDFAYLQLDKLVGKGATSDVYVGKFKSKIVAIKLSTPPEITQEVIDVFVAEAKVNSNVQDDHIVEFVGICVRPPQIAMVFEFCEGGDLKSNIRKFPEKWTTAVKLRASLEAARAIHCLHQQGYIHRDLKAENFFVGKNQSVKQGDFGESTRVRNRESTATRRMTVLGTVAFMAPELINAERHYTQSIDVYALAITFWEIWTELDPYGENSHFEIYKDVSAGKRPPLPAKGVWPQGLTEVFEEAWHQDPMKRPSAGELVKKLEEIRKNYERSTGERVEYTAEFVGEKGDNKGDGREESVSDGSEVVGNPMLRVSDVGEMKPSIELRNIVKDGDGAEDN